MKVLTFRRENQLRLGVKTDVGVIDVAAARAALGLAPDPARVPETIEALLDGGEAARRGLENFVIEVGDKARGSEWLLDEGTLTLGPAVPNPGKILCVGLNYRAHAAESGQPEPSTPVIFSKFNNAIAAPGEKVPLPTVGEQYDYEVELAVVLGRRGRNIDESEALDYVFGYCTANDLSARDLQALSTQWLLGKSLDKFMPIGPYLVTADEVADPQRLQIRSWVNGELRQNSNTSDMIFSVAQIISFISRYMTLEPGDVILTGTPEGVILGMKEKVWLKPGDEVAVEVEGLGRLVNVMTAD